MSMIFEGLRGMLLMVLELLPDSPFRGFIDSLGTIPFLGWLNWFVPISDFLRLLAVWGVAVGLFYVYSVVLRFINAIE